MTIFWGDECFFDTNAFVYTVQNQAGHVGVDVSEGDVDGETNNAMSLTI
jgi:hypothetical protein